ncbi:hypothetical protein RF11_08776 [Thelohanellus kitauei]|uniref:Uncharacterized protein n=1 Tax=Thelohanellus kitauei TaxID=669202 RepID=A0A0C2N4K6_THEKT|nr:hypothetical protein RF11_08776 [Thelohanellus kitauei]
MSTRPEQSVSVEEPYSKLEEANKPVWNASMFWVCNPYIAFFCSQLEVLKPAPVHFCTDFMSTANATVSTYGRDELRGGTLLQAVRVVQDSHLINTHPYLQPTRATIPNRHSFADPDVAHEEIHGVE